MDEEKELFEVLQRVQRSTLETCESALVELAGEIETKLPQTEYYKGYRDGILGAAQTIRPK